MPSYDSRRDSFGSKELAPSGSGRKSLSGLSLDNVLGNKREPPPPLPPDYCRSPSELNRTLLEIFREQDPCNSSYKDKKVWRKFKDRLRLQQAAAAWTLNRAIPASDILLQNSVSFLSEAQKRHHYKGCESDKFCRDHRIMAEENSHGGDNQAYDPTSQGGIRPMMMRRVSTRHNGPVQASNDTDEPMPTSTPDKASMRPAMLRHNSTKMGSMRSDSTRSLGRSESSLLGKDDHPYGGDPDLLGYGSESGRMSRRMLTPSSDDRLMSAREAAAAQEASEAEAAAAREEERNGGLFVQEMSEEQQPERMSLMDLLEQTDEQMGWTGSRYMIGDDDDDEDDEDNDEDVDNDDDDAEESNCCVCLVKHKGSASGPCGHSFCRLCSKELRVGNGHCPSCNDFNLEIIEVF